MGLIVCALGTLTSAPSALIYRLSCKDGLLLHRNGPKARITQKDKYLHSTTSALACQTGRLVIWPGFLLWAKQLAGLRDVTLLANRWLPTPPILILAQLPRVTNRGKSPLR